MTRFVAFLRAINVGGRTVSMADLRQHFLALGLRDVETFIASGNVVFTTGTVNVQRLVERIEHGLRQALGYDVATFLRTDAEVAAIAGSRPFAPSLVERAGAFNVGLLAAPLPPAARKALMRLKTDIDDFHVQGAQVYWLCRKKQSESTFSNSVFERTLNVRATFRTMGTVRRLAAKYGFTSEGH